MTIRSFARLLAVGSLCVFVLVSCFAQTPSTPPVHPRPQTGPGGPPSNPSSQFRATGLEANGGSITAGVYTNSIFGFSLQVPPGWVVAPATDPPPIKPAKGQSPSAATPQTNRVLLLLTENAPFKKSFQRRSIQVIATRLIATPLPTSGEEFLVYSQKTVKERNMPVEYIGDPKEVTINGRSLWEIDFNDNTSGALQHANQSVVLEKDVLLQFFLVSPDEAGLKNLQPYIRSLRFKAASKKSSQPSH